MISTTILLFSEIHVYLIDFMAQGYEERDNDLWKAPNDLWKEQTKDVNMRKAREAGVAISGIMLPDVWVLIKWYGYLTRVSLFPLFTLNSTVRRWVLQGVDSFGRAAWNRRCIVATLNLPCRMGLRVFFPVRRVGEVYRRVLEKCWALVAFLTFNLAVLRLHTARILQWGSENPNVIIKDKTNCTQ